MPTDDRLTASATRRRRRVTGIDFIQVVEPADQTQLRVFFVVDPDTLDVNRSTSTVAPPRRLPAGIDRGRSTTAASPIASSLTWDRLPRRAGGTLARCSCIDVERRRRLQLYRLTLIDAGASRIDRFFNAALFSFKQGCPSRLRLPRARRDCPPEDAVDWPVDYLARDFESFRNGAAGLRGAALPDWARAHPRPTSAA